MRNVLCSTSVKSSYDICRLLASDESCARYELPSLANMDSWSSAL